MAMRLEMMPPDDKDDILKVNQAATHNKSEAGAKLSVLRERTGLPAIRCPDGIILRAWRSYELQHYHWEGFSICTPLCEPYLCRGVTALGRTYRAHTMHRHIVKQ